MSEKRILIVTSELVPFHYGGIGTQFKSLAALLKRHGHHVYLLARRPENFDEATYRSHYGKVPLFFVEIPPIQARPSQHFVYAAEVARRFDEIYPKIRPDLVIFADFNAEGLFLLLRSGSGAYGGTEFLLTIQGMNFEVISVREGSGLDTSASSIVHPDISMLLAMEDLCVHLAPQIVSLTICAWGEICQRLGIRKIARIIPNLVDLHLFHPETTETPEKPRDPLILFVGRLDRMKGTDLLLKAYFEIAERTAPAVPRIVFIGRDCFWNEYGSTFLEHWKGRIPEKYAGAISFLGQVSHDEIRNYLKKATVAVFPSRWEPFGIVCLEAMAMGCPVVVSQGTGFVEVLGPDLAEFAVPVNEDVRPLAQKILSILHAAPRVFSEKLRERAHEVVRQAEEGWLDLLRDLDRKEGRKETSVAGSVCGPIQQLLSSIDDQWRGISYFQIYFSRQGHYSETDSIRRSYAGSRWATLKISLPKGTGERLLRLDPSDAPGTIRIREIVLLDEDGNEIWRTDGSRRFHGCSPIDGEAISIQDSCLVIRAVTNDPQIFLDCPATGRPLNMRVIIYSSG